MDFYTPERDKQRNQVEVAVLEGLPSVLLIGDSISQGYTPIVRDLLKERFNVERPKANVHYTEEGYAIIGSQVAKCIENVFIREAQGV